MLGDALALGSAVFWSVSVILFRKSEAASAQAINLFKNVVASVLLLLTLALVPGIGVDWARSGEDWARLAVSGVLGLVIADNLYFLALRRLGPAGIAIVHCSYAPILVILGVLLLGERVGAGFAVGASLVMIGITVVTTERLPRLAATAATAGRPGGAIVLAVLGILAMGIGVIVAKPALAHGNLVELVTVRLVAGTLVQLVWIAMARTHREALTVLLPGPVWRTLLPGAIFGSYLSMLCWLGGFKFSEVSRASVLNQLATVFTILFARVFLAEALSLRRAVGGAMAVIGAVMVVTGG